MRTDLPDRPQRQVGPEWGLAGRPGYGFRGQAVPGEALREDGSMVRVNHHAVGSQHLRHPCAHLRVVAGERQVTSVEQVDRRPSATRQVVGHVDAGRPSADDGDAGCRVDPGRHRIELGLDLGHVLDAVGAPEPVRRTGGDDEHVIGLGGAGPVAALDVDGPTVQVDLCDASLDSAHPVEPSDPVVGDEVRAPPARRVGQPGPQLLSAHQRRRGRDAHHVARPAEPGRHEQSGVPQSCDHHPWPASLCHRSPRSSTPSPGRPPGDRRPGCACVARANGWTSATVCGHVLGQATSAHGVCR